MAFVFKEPKSAFVAPDVRFITWVEHFITWFDGFAARNRSRPHPEFRIVRDHRSAPDLSR